MRKTKGSSAGAAIVQKQRGETSSRAPRAVLPRIPDIGAGEPRLKKSDSRAGFVADPAVQLRDAFVPPTLLTQRSTLPTIRYSLVGPDNTPLG